MMNADSKKQWAIVSGAWGDVICELGYVKSSGAKNLVYFGPENPAMESFLKCQDFVDNLILVKPADIDDFKAKNSLLMYERTFLEGLKKIIKNKDISPDDFYPTTTVMDKNRSWDRNIEIAKNLNLPQECHEWANDIADKIETDFYIIQPFSINTTTFAAHWPHWHEFIQWISGDLGKKYILSGIGWDSKLYSNLPNVYNMVDKFPTVCHLFALSQKAKGVFSTSNSLAHWCVCQNIPATIIMNTISSDPTYFFNKVIQGDNIQSFTYYASLQRVCFAVYENWGIWSS